MYGATNQAYMADPSEPTIPEVPSSAELPVNADELIQDRPEDERESWDNKLMFLLATIG